MQEKIYEDIYQFLLCCGKEHDPYRFCNAVVKELHRFVLYDQARVIFIGESGKIQSSMLYGVSEKNWKAYLDFYDENIYGSAYSLKTPIRLSENEKVNVCDWTNEERRTKNPDFEEAYVRPLQLKYCLGIGLSDQHNCIRAIISLDRIKNIKFTENEISLIRKLRPLLDNLFINLLSDGVRDFSQRDFVMSHVVLTKREEEIVGLLYHGASPAAISERLCISINTAYKHIANVYKKMGVSNRQELFYLLNRKTRG